MSMWPQLCIHTHRLFSSHIFSLPFTLPLPPCPPSFPFSPIQGLSTYLCLLMPVCCLHNTHVYSWVPPTWIIILGCYRILAQKDGLTMDQETTVCKQFWEDGASAHLSEDGGNAQWLWRLLPLLLPPPFYKSWYVKLQSQESWPQTLKLLF